MDAIAGMDAVVALLQGDWVGLEAVVAHMENPDTFLRALAARMGGRSAEAVTILHSRKEWPEWFKDPIGKPNLDNE